MTPARCFIHPAGWDQPRIELNQDDAHHLLHVLRRAPGDAVELFNGQGGLAEATIEAADRGNVTVAIHRRRQLQRPAPLITLVQALPREQKLDFILQKATELGVARVLPILTENAVVKIKADRADDKKTRWEKIILNAARQCGSAWLPELEPARNLTTLLAGGLSSDLFIVCALTPEAKPLKDLLRGRSAAPASVAVLVGPEGDFSPSELQAILAAGALPAGLGSTVLRSETAAVYAIGALRYEFGL